jgi:hypothetical protein|tara:strand:- start:822 stop:1022 length:201 start_codon:yes stop_codon:yes gene_type:complete
LVNLAAVHRRRRHSRAPYVLHVRPIVGVTGDDVHELCVHRESDVAFAAVHARRQADDVFVEPTNRL